MADTFILLIHQCKSSFIQNNIKIKICVLLLSSINTILSSAVKILGMMRKLKFTLNRKALNQIYLSFLRPLMEYSSSVWDSCTVYEKDSLEKPLESLLG